MSTGMVNRPSGGVDHDRTDKLPLPQLDDSDTGTLAMPVIPVDIADLAGSLREREQALEQANRQVAELAIQVEQLTQQCAGLQQQCAALRASASAEDHAPAAAPEPAPATQRPAPAAEVLAPPPVLRELAELRRQNTRLHEALCSWQAQQGVREAMLAEAGVQVPAPPDTAAAEVADWQARCAALATTLEAERSGLADREAAHAGQLAALHAELDLLRTRPVAPSPAAAAPARATHPIPVGSVLRVLVRQEHGMEVAYPLGRHTSIGRTPDNDIQVNATWVSRHHAVVLAGTDHCIVEDLNSTNGLLVNGHRVDRQVLHDGDTVTIGKTHFRYQQRT